MATMTKREALYRKYGASLPSTPTPVTPPVTATEMPITAVSGKRAALYAKYGGSPPVSAGTPAAQAPEVAVAAPTGDDARELARNTRMVEQPAISPAAESGQAPKPQLFQEQLPSSMEEFSAMLQQEIDAAKARGEIKPIEPAAPDASFGEKFSRSFRAGAAGIVSRLGRAAELVGNKEVGSDVREGFGQAAESYRAGITPTDFKNLSSLWNPDFWATTGGEALGGVAALAPLGAAGGAAGAAGAAAVGAGALGTSIAAAAGGAALSRPVEAAVEAADAYESMIAEGKSETEATSAAKKVFAANLPLGVTDFGEILLALSPLRGGRVGKIMAKVMKAPAAGIVKKGADVIGSAAMEGVEEVVQEGIQRAGQGKSLTENPEAYVKAGGTGFGVGLPFGVGAAVTQVRPRATAQQAQPAQTTVQPTPQDVADDEMLRLTKAYGGRFRTAASPQGDAGFDVLIRPGDSPGTAILDLGDQTGGFLTTEDALKKGQLEQMGLVQVSPFTTGFESNTPAPVSPVTPTPGKLDRAALIRQLVPNIAERDVQAMVAKLERTGDEAFLRWAERELGNGAALTLPPTEAPQPIQRREALRAADPSLTFDQIERLATQTAAMNDDRFAAYLVQQFSYSPPGYKASQTAPPVPAVTRPELQKVDRAAIIRQARPQMDERGVQDTVSKAASMSDERFRQWAADELGWVPAAPAQSAPAKVSEPAVPQSTQAAPVPTPGLPAATEQTLDSETERRVSLLQSRSSGMPRGEAVAIAQSTSFMEGPDFDAWAAQQYKPAQEAATGPVAAAATTPLPQATGAATQPKANEIPPAGGQTTPEVSPKQQRQDYRKELAQVRKGKAEAEARRTLLVNQVAFKLAKEATQANAQLRKEFSDRIRQYGLIGPYQGAHLKEDFYGRVPKHLRRQGGTTLDVMAANLGYASEEELLQEIERFDRVRVVKPAEVIAESEAMVDYSEPDLRAKLDYYAEAEQAVLTALAELEGNGRAQTETTDSGSVQDQAAIGAGEGGPVGADRAGGGSQGSGGSGSAQAQASLGGGIQAMAAPGRLLGSTPPTASQGAVKRIDIVRHFTEGLKVPIRTGRFMAKALGIFKIRQEAIRTQLAEDLRTITHEVGHYLDKRFTLTTDAAYDTELLPLGQVTSLPNYSVEDVRAEGVAEFTNLYLTDKALAQQAAPQFFTHFDAAVANDKKVQQVVAQGQKMLHTYVRQNATDMVKSGISYTPPKEKWTWDRLRQVGLDLYEAWTDKHDPILVAEKLLNKGQQMPTRLSPKAQADLARGWEGKAKVFLEKGVVDEQGKKLGPSLKEILEPIGAKLDDFAAYAAAMRALYLHKTRGWDDLKFPFPLWAARDTVQQYDSPEFQKALKELQEFQDAVLQYYAESGFLSPQQLAQIRAANEVYAPFLREQVEAGPGVARYLGPKYANVGNAVTKMKGGTGTIINPLHSVIHNTFKLINLAHRNNVAVALANLADKAEGGGRIVEDVTKSFRPATFELGQIKDVINEAMADSGLDADDVGMDLSAVATVFSPNTMPSAGDAAKGIFAVYRNGKTKFYQADPKLYRALLAMDKPAYNWAIKLLSVVTVPKRTFAVLTPEFVARNFGRDVLTAGVYGRGLPLEAHMRGILAQIFNKEAVARWEAGGGFHSSTVSVDRDYQKETVKRLVGGKLHTLRENLMPPWRALQNLSELIERSPRIGEMLMAEEGSALEKKLLGLGKSTVDTPTAILESRDLTLDFGRSGNQGQQLNQITAFFNAWMQDADKFFRMHSNPKTVARVMARGALFLTLPTLLLWLQNRDDEEYKEFPQWRKDLFWNFKVGGRWWMWPAPHVLALVYKAIPERIFNAIYQEDPEAITKGMGETAEGLAAPNLIPDALALSAELKFNWDFFGDRPIVPRGEEQKEAAQQAGPYTPEVAKRVGGAINVSPRKIEKAVTSTLAGGGRYAMGFVDKLLAQYDKATGKPEPPEKSTREAPFVRAFSSANPLSQGAQSVDDFYRLKEKQDTLWNSLPGRADVSKPLGDYAKWTTAERAALKDVLSKLTDEEQELIGGDFNRWRTQGKPDLNKAAATLSSYSKAKAAVEKSNLSATAKRVELDRLDKLRLNLARKALGKPPM